MADRVYAAIQIGGALAAPDFAELFALIADEGLSSESTDEPFEPDHRVPGELVHLYAHEVAWGCFLDLEAFGASRRVCPSHDGPRATAPNGARSASCSPARATLDRT